MNCLDVVFIEHPKDQLQTIIIIIKGTTKRGIRHFITFYITLFRFVQSIFGSLDLWIFIAWEMY